LQHVKIGVHLIGDDMSNAPPAHALAKRGVVNNVVGFTVYGDYTRPNPAATLIEAVLSGEIDVAIAWGPLAGWVAKQQKHKELVVTPVKPARDGPYPFVFDISVGVRRGESNLKAEIERALFLRRRDIDALLESYGIPRR
jgi:mxaJ protein